MLDLKLKNLIFFFFLDKKNLILKVRLDTAENWKILLQNNF